MYLAELRKLIAQLKKYRMTCEPYSSSEAATDALMRCVSCDIILLEKEQSEIDVAQLSRRLKKQDKATLATALRLAGVR